MNDPVSRCSDTLGSEVLLAGKKLRVPSAMIDPQKPGVFGVALTALLLRDNSAPRGGWHIPRVVDQVLRRIRALGGQRRDGVFSHPGDHALVARIVAAVDAGLRGRELLQMSTSVHDWVSVLHRWMVLLPTPLLPWEGALGRKLDELARWSGPWYGSGVLQRRHWLALSHRCGRCPTHVLVTEIMALLSPPAARVLQVLPARGSASRLRSFRPR